jgi:predicted acylesterase/phospholipase RssA
VPALVESYVASGRKGVGAFALSAPAVVPPELHRAAQVALLPDAAWPTSLMLATIDADSGELVRLGAGWGASLADGVAATRALPGVIAPVEVAGRALMDGAIGSATNADLLPPGLDLAIVVTPWPVDPEPGSFEALYAEALREERAALRFGRTHLHVIHADARAREAMGDDLMSAAGARAAVAAGREQGLAAVAQISPRRAAAAAAAALDG